jgi:hypothetical protein
MISIVLYPDKKVLHIRFSDFVTVSQFDEFHRKLPHLLAPLSEGFVLISDFSALTEMEFACWKPVGSMMERMVQAGVSEVIRIIKDTNKDIGCGILSNFHYPARLSVKVFDNLPEVLERLELNIKQDIAADWITGKAADETVDKSWHTAV